MAQNSSFRKKPNILITGTPGTGKTTMAAALEEVTELRHINVCGFANEKNLTNGWDDTFDCYYINEGLVCRELENFMEEGGNIVDHYGCDFFPDDWFDLVVILQTDNSVLYDRFIKRGYSNQKLASNTECRMFLVLLEAAKENYSEDIVVILRSDSLEDITKNVEILTSWISHWRSPVASISVHWKSPSCHAAASSPFKLPVKTHETVIEVGKAPDPDPLQIWQCRKTYLPAMSAMSSEQVHSREASVTELNGQNSSEKMPETVNSQLNVQDSLSEQVHLREALSTELKGQDSSHVFEIRRSSRSRSTTDYHLCSRSGEISPPVK